MDPQIVAALITGSFGVFGTLAATKAHSLRRLNPIAPDRRAALTGKWYGSLTQPSNLADVEIELRAARRAISGKAELRLEVKGQQKLIVLELTGGFFHDRFLKLDYRNVKRETIQFGSVVLELAAEPYEMWGVCAGYGSVNERIVYGQLAIKRRLQ